MSGPGTEPTAWYFSSGAPWVSCSAVTFARSITLPPPTATITSARAASPRSSAASTAERGTSTAASEKTVTSSAPSESRTVAKPGVVAITGSVMTSTRCPCSAATSPAAAARPGPNSTWDGARRTAKSVIYQSPGTW